MNSNRVNRRVIWRVGVSSGINGGVSISILDGFSISFIIRIRNVVRTSVNFFFWI